MDNLLKVVLTLESSMRSYYDMGTSVDAKMAKKYYVLGMLMLAACNAAGSSFNQGASCSRRWFFT
jgi:hypothetical protein